ncbi:MAG: hypothetical protein IT373_37550 [Polyangiaceae bacterium]|nr:hypothetical protein [Polyangiaceae bacterium]
MKRLLVPLLMAVAGCGPDFEKLCSETHACEGGNDEDEKACVVELDYRRDVADIVGCTSELDAYYDCLIEHATCRMDSLGLTCTTSSVCGLGGQCINGTCQFKSYGLEDPDVCEAEDNAYDHCSDFIGGIP